MKKKYVSSGSQQLRAAKVSWVTGANVTGGKISIAAEGQSGPENANATFAFLWKTYFQQSKHWIALHLMQLVLEDKAKSPREDVAILIAVELFRIDYT